jgi:hypothetical protein
MHQLIYQHNDVRVHGTTPDQIVYCSLPPLIRAHVSSCHSISSSDYPRVEILRAFASPRTSNAISDRISFRIKASTYSLVRSWHLQPWSLQTVRKFCILFESEQSNHVRIQRFLAHTQRINLLRWPPSHLEVWRPYSSVISVPIHDIFILNVSQEMLLNFSETVERL